MISRVYLKNWKSHHETELTFTDGVNVLVGEMGAGKSSVVDGILFGLYGTTPALQSRKVTLDQVMRRSPTPAQEAVVELDIAWDGDTYTVRRELSRSGETVKTDTSELRKNGELVEAPQTSAVTEEVEELLGVDYELFARAIYAEQNELDYFLTLRSGERKQKVDELLELDRFESARGTLVTLINRLEGRRQDREEDLEDLEASLDEDEIAALREEQEEDKEKLEEMKENLKELDDQHEAVMEEFKELKEKKEDFEDLKQKRTELEKGLEFVTEDIAELENEAGDLASLTSGQMEERRKKLSEKKKELEQKQKRITELEKELSVLREGKKEAEKGIEELKEQTEKLDELDNLAEKLDEQKEVLEELKTSMEEKRVRLKDMRESLKNLASASETCPTCGQALTEEHRVEFLKSRKEEKLELEETLAELAEQKEEKIKKAKQLEEKKEKLLQYQNVNEKLEEKQEELEELDETLKEKTEALEQLQEAFSTERLEALQDERERLRSVKKLLKRQEKKDEYTEQLEQVNEDMNELEFKEEKLETLQERMNEVREQRTEIRTTLDERKNTVNQRGKRLEELEEKQERVAEHREQIETYREKHDVLNQLQQALERTQVELRERFINSVNDVMDETWQQIYPYDDYDGIRLNAGDGYALEVQDADDRWIPVEGAVSGGERHAAALTLRIALSLLLAPNWRLLILDEPTHNLDVTAIEELGQTLRTQVSDILGQVFLITHEERLETAVTGDLYKLSKKETQNGLTAVRELTET